MSSWTWKIKQFFNKVFPIALIGAVLYGAVSMYNQGAFRRGLKPAITTMLYKLPYFGTRYKHYNRGKSYAYSSRKKYRGHRRGHSRRNRRHHR